MAVGIALPNLRLRNDVTSRTSFASYVALALTVALACCVCVVCVGLLEMVGEPVAATVAVVLLLEPPQPTVRADDNAAAATK